MQAVFSSVCLLDMGCHFNPFPAGYGLSTTSTVMYEIGRAPSAVPAMGGPTGSQSRTAADHAWETLYLTTSTAARETFIIRGHPACCQFTTTSSRLRRTATACIRPRNCSCNMQHRITRVDVYEESKGIVKAIEHLV